MRLRLAVMTLEASAPAMAQTPTPLVAQWREVTRYFAITSKDRQLCRVDRKLRWTGGSLLDLARLIGERQSRRLGTQGLRAAWVPPEAVPPLQRARR